MGGIRRKERREEAGERRQYKQEKYLFGKTNKSPEAIF
jgi:hypothetical protein